MTIQLEPAAEAFVQATAQPPYPFELGPEQGRAILARMQSGPADAAQMPVEIEERVIAGGPTSQVAIRILRPQLAVVMWPVLVFIHGGGWVFGGLDTHDRLIRELAVGAAAAVVFPDYSRSPAARYPTALEECYAVLQWVATHGGEHRLDLRRLAVAGDGVGGNLAAALTLLAKERGGPTISQQVLFYPATDARCGSASYQQFATGYWLRRDAMIWFWEQYTANLGERMQITASPLRASTAQLQRLPPALIITAEADVLRDEGEAYAAKLRQAGVSVTAVRFGGTIHDFLMLHALADTAAARGALTLATAWLRTGFAAPR